MAKKSSAKHEINGENVIFNGKNVIKIAARFLRRKAKNNGKNEDYRNHNLWPLTKCPQEIFCLAVAICHNATRLLIDSTNYLNSPLDPSRPTSLC